MCSLLQERTINSDVYCDQLNKINAVIQRKFPALDNCKGISPMAMTDRTRQWICAEVTGSWPESFTVLWKAYHGLTQALRVKTMSFNLSQIYYINWLIGQKFHVLSSERIQNTLLIDAKIISIIQKKKWTQFWKLWIVRHNLQTSLTLNYYGMNWTDFRRESPKSKHTVLNEWLGKSSVD